MSAFLQSGQSNDLKKSDITGYYGLRAFANIWTISNPQANGGLGLCRHINQLQKCDSIHSKQCEPVLISYCEMILRQTSRAEIVYSDRRNANQRQGM